MRPSVSGPLRLAATLRGKGVLLWGKQGQAPVSYAVDVYRQGPSQVANGDVRGDLARLAGRAPTDARLRLANGEEVRVSLADIDVDMASIEVEELTSAPLPMPKPERSRARRPS